MKKKLIFSMLLSFALITGTALLEQPIITTLGQHGGY